MANQSDRSIQFHAGKYIALLFPEQLSSDLFFHNFHHTLNVVQGVRDIGEQLQLDIVQKEILELAAWFHDSGHIKTYEGHEAASQQIAKDFLIAHQYPADKIEQVMACIDTTKMPQQPESLLQKVICDADLYHLSLPEYPHLQHQLRREWEQVLGKHYTNENWTFENLAFLENHHYFTSYGQEVLEKRKLENITRFRQFMEEFLGNTEQMDKKEKA